MKGCGYDVRAVREIVKIRKQDQFRTQGDGGHSRTLHGGFEYDVGVVLDASAMHRWSEFAPAFAADLGGGCGEELDDLEE